MLGKAVPRNACSPPSTKDAAPAEYEHAHAHSWNKLSHWQLICKLGARCTYNVWVTIAMAGQNVFMQAPIDML
jgi:hypothetical protein